jgi:hypothetical protein
MVLKNIKERHSEQCELRGRQIAAPSFLILEYLTLLSLHLRRVTGITLPLYAGNFYHFIGIPIIVNVRQAETE